MRAGVLRGTDEPISAVDVHLDPPGRGDVKVKVAAAGVCHSDPPVKPGEWLMPLPLVLGHEGSGVVIEVGAGVTGLRQGNHVVLPWVTPCGACRRASPVARLVAESPRTWSGRVVFCRAPP
jgi:S-(hydroxymethyl)glutathione dehydrogenase/alcohol dehydrogenase